MWTISKISKASDIVLGVFTGLLAAVCLIYSLYVLYDNFYTEQSAFSSWDLVRYKPAPGNEGKFDFDELQKINKDVIGWITIDDTNIDYPVLQGKDDLEYINKDPYGKSSLTGSIYLSSSNHSDLSDMYNIVYGHHMDNGAMFGDIDKFAEKAFFESHRRGIYITPKKAYQLHVFAFLETNAYESRIYTVNEKNKEALDSLYTYLKDHARIYDDIDHTKASKLIALSTCASNVTNGRNVIFCDAVETTEAILPKDTAVPASTDFVVKGHGSPKGGWALLNAVCVLIALYTLLPLIHTGKKYRQIFYSKRKAKELEQTLEAPESVNDSEAVKSSARNSPMDQTEELSEEDRKEIASDLRKHVKKMIVGIIAESLLVLTAAVVFILTENIFSPMVISDRFTWVMVLFAILGLIIDFILFRYRGKLPPGEHSKNDHRQSAPLLSQAS